MRVHNLGGLFSGSAVKQARLNDPLLAGLQGQQVNSLLHYLDCDLIARDRPPYSEVLAPADSVGGIPFSGTPSNVPVIQPGGSGTFPGTTRAALLATQTTQKCDLSLTAATVTDSFTLIAVVRPAGVANGAREARLFSAYAPVAPGNPALTASWYLAIAAGSPAQLVLVEPTSAGLPWTYGTAFQDAGTYIVAATVDHATKVLKIFVDNPNVPKATVTAASLPVVPGGIWTVGGGRLFGATAWAGLMAAPCIFGRDLTLVPGGQALPNLFSLLNAQYALGKPGL